MNKYIKTIISIICILSLIVSIVVVVKNKMPKKKEEITTTGVNNTLAQTDANEESLPRLITDSDGIVKGILAPSQIITDTSGPIALLNRKVETEFVVSDAIISRELKHSPAIEEDIERVRNRMIRDYSESINVVYEEDVETFKEGIAFYVYFTVTIKNINDSEAYLNPSNIELASINYKDESYVAMECVGYNSRPEYKKYGFLNYALYHHCIGGIDYIVDGNKFGQTYNYKPGESLNAEVILAVPEEDIKNDCLYIYYSFGKVFNRAVKDTDYRFIKLNLTNRGDYFE